MKGTAETVSPSFIDFPEMWARYHTGRTALVSGDTGEELTYGDLHRRVERTACHLVHELGLKRGDRVAVLAYNDPFFFELAFACIRTGLVLAPLNYRLAAVELGKLLELGAPQVVFVDRENLAVLEELAWQPEKGVWLISDHVEEVSLLEGGAPTGDGPGPGGPAPDFTSPGSGFTGAAPDDPVLLLFTSGTTGRPKAVVLPARQIFWNGVNTRLAFDLTRRDRTLIYTPLFHTGGINVLAMPLFQSGGTVVLHRAFDAGKVLKAVGAHGITVIFGVPTTFQFLAGERAFEQSDLVTLRLCLCGGAPLPVSLIQTYRERGLKLTQGFGMTEVGPNCFYLPEQDVLERAGSVGKPMPHTRTCIVKGGREARPGEVGELWLAGPVVCSGYFRNPEASEAARVGEWFRTGDLARRDEAGFFTIAGRKKEMFISGGENIYPAEVETALAGHREVCRSAVVAMKDARWGEVGCAFVEARGGFADGEALSAYLRKRIAGYKVPKRYVFMERLPLSESGKVLKERLPLGESGRGGSGLKR